MKYKITNNERTVWVNSPDRCIGRFCPASHEFLNDINDLEFKTNKRSNMSPTTKDWKTSCSLLKEKHGILISSKFKSVYLRVV
jgi:hypothetical protein